MKKVMLTLIIFSASVSQAVSLNFTCHVRCHLTAEYYLGEGILENQEEAEQYYNACTRGCDYYNAISSNAEIIRDSGDNEVPPEAHLRFEVERKK